VTLNASTPENTVPSNPLVTVVALDIDNMSQSTFEYALVGDDAMEFTVTSSGALFLHQAQDREAVSRLQVGVQVSDGINVCPYQATVTVMIEDLNDNPPIIFPPTLDVSIQENNLEPHVANLTAEDADASPAFSTIVRFSLETFAPGVLLPFMVTSRGEILSTRPLDAETDPQMFEFQVFAFDSFGLKSLPANITVNIGNQNDHEPEFSQSQYYATISEDTPANTTILRVSAFDRDVGVYGMISYALTTGDFPFIIDTSTGSIISSRAFDFEIEEVTLFSFGVVTTDGGGLVATANVTIEIGDVDEFAPEIDQERYSTCIREGTPLQHVVLTVTATDGDSSGNNIRFEMLPSARWSPSQIPFEILTNGTVVTANFLSDYETNPPSYNFSVIAVDSGGRTSEPASVEICIIDLNDNPPFFQPSRLKFAIP